MMTRYISAGLVALILAGPGWAEVGTQRGKTQQQKVASPQSLARYARSWGLAAEQLAWANGLSPEAETGGKVTLPARILPANPPADGVVVNLAERGMYAFRGGEFQGFFPLAIGRGDKVEFRTPTGTYKMVDRQKNPPWISPKTPWTKAMKKEKIKGDDKSNPLGEYWFGFDHPKGGYGFHENTQPETTGDKVSHGCMRLYPEHAKKLYYGKLLMPGDSVRIEDRPIVLGKQADGTLSVAVFPNAYGKADLQAKLTKELKKEGLLGMVSPDRIKALVAKRNGVPQPLLGKAVSLSIDGKPAQLGTPAVRREGSLMVPVALAREVGCDVAYDGKTGLITVSKDGKSKPFALDAKAKGPQAFRWGDQTMVAARPMLDAMDIDYAWNAKANKLEVQR